MDESTPITASDACSHSESETSPLLELPPELVLGTIQFLSREDQQTFSLLSQACRQLAVPFLFCKVVYSRNVAEKIQALNQAEDNIKAAIRDLTLDESRQSAAAFHESIIFQLLETLPKLRAFRWQRLWNSPTSLSGLVASLQHCPLEHLEYWRSNAVSEPAIGLSGLRSLALKTFQTSLYDLILPSFSTLVELRIRYPEDSISRTFDLLPLKPIGTTLQKFFYKAHVFDPQLLETIPVVFPNLTTLEVMFWDTPKAQWKKQHDEALSRNKNLEYLAVFAGGSSFCDTQIDNTSADCQACADHRAKAAHALATVCIGLRRCTWDNRLARYKFNVKHSRAGSAAVDTDADAEGKNNGSTRTPWKVERSSSGKPRGYRQSWFRCVELEHRITCS